MNCPKCGLETSSLIPRCKHCGTDLLTCKPPEDDRLPQYNTQAETAAVREQDYYEPAAGEKERMPAWRVILLVLLIIKGFILFLRCGMLM